MVKLADAFLMLPGGYGTLDEMMEIVTWKQLRLHAKPCILIQHGNLLGRLARISGSRGRCRISESGKPPTPGSRTDGGRSGPNFDWEQALSGGGGSLQLKLRGRYVARGSS